MLKPMFLKMSAREKLKGNYWHFAYGALIYYVPVYIISCLSSLLMLSGGVAAMVAPIVVWALTIITSDVIYVGYTRMLLEQNRAVGDEMPRNINTVFSGYQNNFKNTLKIIFLKNIYLLGWQLLIFLPMLVFGGIIAFMSNTPEIAQVISMAEQLVQTPTPDMMMNIAEYISANCPYVAYIMMGAELLSLVMFIPYIRKNYEYTMIATILADSPDISAKDAFAKTRLIMNGFRWKYFCVQLSFIGIMILAMVAMVISPAQVLYYLVMIIAMPYMSMTYLEFYTERVKTLNNYEETGKESE